MIEDMGLPQNAVMSAENMIDLPMTASVNGQVHTQVIEDMVTNTPLQLVDIPVVNVDMGSHQKGITAALIATAARMAVQIESMILTDTTEVHDIHPQIVDMPMIDQRDMTEVAAVIQLVMIEAMPLKEATP